MGGARPEPGGALWLATIRRYLPVMAALSLAWETAQLPFHTLWREAMPVGMAFAVLHGTAGDMLIAAAALGAELLVLGAPGWPGIGFARVLTAATAIGLGCTVWSEWRNTAVRGSWAYAGIMPVLPPFSTGLLPLPPWLLLPPLGLVLARWRAIIPQPPCVRESFMIKHHPCSAGRVRRRPSDDPGLPRPLNAAEGGRA
jgi:hypothetical protein